MSSLQNTLQKIATLQPAERSKALAELGRLEYDKCANDIVYWLSPELHSNIPYVYTHDPHPMYECSICKGSGKLHVCSNYKMKDHLNAYHSIVVQDTASAIGYFTHLPHKRPLYMKPYMKPIIETWLAYPYVAIEKSRDMMATWLVVMMYTWDTIFHAGRQNIFQSEDASKTLELVTRSNFIYSHQPKFLRSVVTARFSKGESKSGILRFDPIDSEILGFPQGGDQIRQYHPSGLFADEAAFQIKAADAFAAIKPSIQNGGRYTALSTPNPSYFMAICRDTSDTTEG